MEYFVDGELPKNCKECPFMIDRGELKSSRLCYEKNFVNCDCKLNPNIGYIGITKPYGCPLQTTQSLKQQVREEVVEEIKKIADSIFARYENRELDDVAYGELVCCNILIKKFQRKEGNEQC